ncbi:ABC transporter substrate-binding protein [Natronococcus occultus]|uniref:ABC-type nitrate/sulfonate/bicarbonate transport system, periplasmic component n=1 Tax=Natronococcus occultus SP4 TaxID=694430 RepID=L0JVI9_9EURY|nr:ABC transporter substrate-binding protein [Natronococcus occultus]AGB37052.1 ABC-type nitrate/sulfonate/bicarbonate transport system, periplasmic component [Natronococcus occultus SP4]
MPENNTLNLFHLPFSFVLPQRVAVERGYFEEEGVDVDLIERDRRSVEIKYIPAEETLTGDYEVDLYPVCKWESLKRTWGMGDGKVVANGTFADQPYTVFTRSETAIESPSDLAGVEVAVNRRTGQEYTAMRALEEHVAPEDVHLVHYGMPTDRLRALRDEEVDAVTLLDPQSTLAEQLGFEPVLEFENHMGIVGGDAVDTELLEAYVAAYTRAVRDINADPESFREEYLEMLEKDAQVAPDLFEDVDMDALREQVTVPRYEVPDLADREDLGTQLEWMKERELIDDEAEIDAIVASLG